MLIVSLPPVHQEKLLREIIANPNVGAVRYNTGVRSAYDPRETLQRILKFTAPHGKPLYVDLKGRQLRVTEWANLPEGPIMLNHRIKVSLPAKVYFRGDDCCELKEVVSGKEIFVDPLPKYPVGRDQAVNILADNLEIEGGLLPLDRAYIEAALKEGIARFMLSFVESLEDVRELEDAILQYWGRSKPFGKYELVLKIESNKGVEFVREAAPALLSPYRLEAARDDLMIQIGVHKMPDALRIISQKDENAICASRLLMGLETGEVSMADISDLEYMRHLGYKTFMLSDGISREHFPAAMQFWQAYRAR
jgi:pyruvate kinase